jgi:hypothetical protein
VSARSQRLEGALPFLSLLQKEWVFSSPEVIVAS